MFYLSCMKRSILVAAFVLSACATWSVIPYEPQSLASTRFETEVRHLLTSSHAAFAPIKFEVTPAYLTSYFRREHSISQSTFVFAQVDHFELLAKEGSNEPARRVEFYDRSGTKLYEYDAVDEHDAHAFIDLIMSAAKPVANAQSTKSTHQL